jgi:F420-dependent oxidoreductase-like protein
MARGRPQFGIDTAQHQQTWGQLLERVRFAEDAGFDGIWLFDHFKALYGDPQGPCLESWTLLAALAAATTRIRVGPMVTGMTYRHPSLLAMEAVTVDHVSGGRVELAVGAAWFEQEHRELGFDFPRTHTRAEQLEEGVQIMRLLMTEDGVSFHGKHFQLNDATYRPRPVQQPHPPIWIGADGEQLMLPIVARQADVWHSSAPFDIYHRKSQLLDRLTSDAGRDAGSIRRAASVSLDAEDIEIKRKIEQFLEIGVSYIYLGWPSAGQRRVDEFARRIMPDYR